MAADIERVLNRPQADATADLPDLTLDDDEPLASVLDPPKTVPPRAGVSRPSLLAEPIAAPHAEPPARAPWMRSRAVWIGAAAALALAIAVPVLRGRRAEPPRRAADAPARVDKESPAAREAVSGEPSPAEEAPAEGEGKLEVDFEHHLRSGRIQVWVDDDEVLDEQLDSRVARKILSLRLRKGEVQQVLPVPAGRHEVRVRLAWSDKVRTSRITGSFSDGQTRTLRVRVSRLFNDLSLGWD